MGSQSRRAFIPNPDLLQRFAHGWPSKESTDMKTWYCGDAEGYTTFPPYQPAPLGDASGCLNGCSLQ